MAATTVLLERENELAAIERLLGAATGGVGGILAIEGEAGAGKTSLLEASFELGARSEMTVLRARGGEYERDFPYGVVRQLFEPALGEPAQRQLLSGSAALAGPVFDPTALAESGDPFAIGHGLYWLVADMAASQPLLLLVDDAQWGDLASLRALAYIARRLDGLRACLLVAVRTGDPGEPVELLDELRRECRERVLEPSPLSVDAAGKLVGGEFGRAPSPYFARACCDATAGNPFLLAELARAVGPAEIDRDGGAEHLAELGASGASRSILARMGRIGDHAVEVARATAVLEPNAEVRLIAALTGLGPEEVTEAGERLIAARLLSDASSLSFIHPLVRAAVLSDIPEPRRAGAHARAARLLREDGAEVDTVAAHLLLAAPGADAWAVAELRAAAAAALGRGAPDAAVRYLRRALREPPPAEERLATSRELGTALLRANDPEGLELLRTVRAAVEEPAQRAEIAAELAGSLGLRGGCEEGAALLEESLEELADPGSPLGLHLRGYLLLQLIWGLERIPAGRLQPDEEIDNGTTFGRLLIQEEAVLNAMGEGSMERALELALLAVADQDAMEEDAFAGLPHQLGLLTLFLADRGDLAERLLEPMLEGSKRRGALPAISGNYGMRALCHLVDGDLREAQADAETAVEIARPFGLPAHMTVWPATLIRVLVERGAFEAAEKTLAELPDRRQILSGSPAAALLCARGELRHATGRHAEARHDFLAASKRIEVFPGANPEIYPWRTGLSLCEAALGNREEAQWLAAEAVERARDAGGARGIGIALRVQGSVASGDPGIELLRESTEILAATRARLQYAHSLVELGAMLRRANSRKDAREPLRKGLDLAHRCDATPLEERARTELAATGARPRRAILSGVESLTPSELRVARMAAEGMTNREIAQSLTVTEKTIETHLRHVYQKLDIAGRTGLAGVLELGSPAS